ncbi:MAG TPA: type III PLP-dependent enzyme [Mycobacteriales bacterium]|nr:type III PLP-dependent enzyme [Mycobacteriales bacterium]
MDAVEVQGGLHPHIARFLADQCPPTPCLVLSTDVVAERYDSLQGACPTSSIYYAVKANPEIAVLRLLAERGACFDVASPAEIDACLMAGAAPSSLSYGNTIKKKRDIAYAYARGVRLFAFDSEAELTKIADVAPGAAVFCRILTSNVGADWPLSRKFGCDPTMAVDLLLRADELGLLARGVSFHVGSQQRDPRQWDAALAHAADVFRACAEQGLALTLVNLGGGFPAHYIHDVPAVAAYGEAIGSALLRHFGAELPDTIVEPGRYIAGDAGVLQCEVVLVSRKSYGDAERWVYLDTGVFGGLAETLGESIKYRMITSRDGGPTGPVILAGPTCDSLDVMYEKHRYELPLDLQAGDFVTILSAGAYTKAYCTDGFNGFEPMPAFCLNSSGRAVDEEGVELPHVVG